MTLLDVTSDDIIEAHCYGFRYIVINVLSIHVANNDCSGTMFRPHQSSSGTKTVCVPENVVPLQSLFAP